jgi:hypothetical protein
VVVGVCVKKGKEKEGKEWERQANLPSRGRKE